MAAKIMVKAQMRPSRVLLLFTRYNVIIDTVNIAAARSILSMAIAFLDLRIENRASDSSTL